MASVKTSIAGLVIAGALAGGVYEGTVSEGPRDRVEPGEIVELRTEKMKFFPGAAKGDTVVHVFAEAVHWRPFGSAQGPQKAGVETAWKAIDLEVKPKPVLRRMFSERPYEITAGPWTAEFPEKKEWNYRFAAGGAAVEYTARFDTIGTVEILIDRSAGGIKETVVLLNASAPKVLEWNVMIDGIVMRAERSENGWEVWKDGKKRFRIERLTAWDAAGKSVAVTGTLEVGESVGVLRAEVDVAGAQWPVYVDPSTTVETGSQRGTAYNSGAVYLTQRNATSGFGVVTTGIQAGTSYDGAGGPFGTRRGFLHFSLPGMIATQSCTLFVNGSSDASDTNFDVNIFGANKARPTLTTADYQNFNGWKSSGAYDGTVLNETWNTSSYSADWNAIVFNAAGRDSIAAAQGDTLWIALLSARDVAATSPSGDEWVAFEASGNVPYLSLTYTIPTVRAPTLQLSPITGALDSLLLTWTKPYSDNIDSLIVFTWPDSQRVAVLTKTADSHRIGGLNPYTQGKYYVRADSAGIYGYSNPDSLWTAQTLKTQTFALLSGQTGFAQNAATAVHDSARTETIPDSLTAGGGSMGQAKIGSEFYIFRHFESVLLPKMTRVQACTTLVYVETDNSATDFVFGQYPATWRGGTAAKNRYTRFIGWVAGMGAYNLTPLTGTLSTSGINTGATANKLPWTKAGRDSVLKWGAAPDTLRTMMLSSRDITPVAPTGNEYLEINDITTAIKLTYAPPDSVPGNVTVTAVATDSVQVTWLDRNYTERGYMVIDNATGLAVSDTLDAGTTSYGIGGLSVNTSYTYQVKVLGGSLNGSMSAAVSEYTLAAVPGVSGQTFPAPLLMKIVVDANGNPAWTPIAIQDSLSGLYVQSATGVCTWGGSPDWKTFSQWGGALGDTVGVLRGKTYGVRVKAKSGQ